MISLDQVLLLEQKVENAVARIAQLNAENAALRRKCAELTNALSAKTEQFSSFQSDQDKIEAGILKALERLNNVENAVYAASEAVKDTQEPAQNSSPDISDFQETNSSSTESLISEEASGTETGSVFEDIPSDTFDTAEPAAGSGSDYSEPSETQDSEDPLSDQPQFDIF